MLQVLAGPIVRRVEPRLATVWVALNEPCRVALDVFTGVQTAGSLPTPEFHGEAHTLRALKWLHVVAVTIEAKDANVLTSERLYSYNLTFTRDSGGTESLRSLNLLADRTSPKPHLALGYQTDALPTFVLTPRQITDLRIVHASCRRPNAAVPDGMRWIDDLILANRADPKKRPHQLFLTGDQIYADDVSTPMLAMIMDVCKMEDDLQEHLPTRFGLQPGQPGTRVLAANAVNFPPRLRKNLTVADARFTSSDGTSHVLTFAEFCALHLFSWCNEIWPETIPTAADVFKPFPANATIPEIWRLHIGMVADEIPKADKAMVEVPCDDDDGTISKLTTLDAASVNKVLACLSTGKHLESYNADVKLMQGFRDGLAKVRRAMANVPVYMIFDDHEVTDDWNYSAIWVDRVNTSPLGRTVVRNGLMAYALCQGWGNDPKKFAEPGPNKDLLTRIPQLFPEGETLPPVNAAADAIDALLGLQNNLTPKIRWNYTVPGEKHLAVVLDVRTQRTFATRIAPPGNLSDQGLKDQIPALPLPPQFEVVILVSSLTVLGPPIFDAVFAPLAYKLFDIAHGNRAAIPGMNPDAIEAWPNDEVALEKLLAAVAPFNKVVMLSGDVHYATSVGMSYWKKRDNPPARFAQFTSSGARNKFKDVARVASQTFAFMQKVIQFGASPERLGYKQTASDLVTLPVGTKPAAALDRRLQQSPALLPTLGWPDGTVENATKPPDWAWRAEVVRDVRPDSERPAASRAAILVPESPGQDIQANLDGYRRVVVRHGKQLEQLNHTRQLLFAANIGLVYFDKTNGFSAIQDLLAVHPKATDPDAPDVYVRTAISLDVPAGGAPKIG